MLADLFKRNASVVLGIDCSTNSVAYAKYVNQELCEWGEIHFKGRNTFERLADGQRKLRSLGDRLSANMVVVESAVYVQNKKTVILMAYALGAILSAIVTPNTIVKEMVPTEWQYAIGNGPLDKSEKAVVMKDFPGKSKTWYSDKFRKIRKSRTADWVERTYGTRPNSDNVTDAIAIGWVGARKFARA